MSKRLPQLLKEPETYKAACLLSGMVCGLGYDLYATVAMSAPDSPVLACQAWNLTGDAFTTHPGEKPWISEMYGYSYGCSSADVWHKTDQSGMLYPGYTPAGLAGASPLPAPPPACAIGALSLYFPVWP